MRDVEKLCHDSANIAGVILEEVVVNTVDKIPDPLLRQGVQSKLALYLMVLEWDLFKARGIGIDDFLEMVKVGVLNIERAMDEKSNRNRG